MGRKLYYVILAVLAVLILEHFVFNKPERDVDEETLREIQNRFGPAVQAAPNLDSISPAPSADSRLITKSSSKPDSVPLDDTHNGNDEQHNFRFPNKLIGEYDEFVADKIRKLSEDHAGPMDIELVSLAKQMLDKPPQKSQPMKLSRQPKETAQTKEIDKLLKSKRNGLFIECGAYDGEQASTTVFFERHRNWTGLLVEPDPGYYTQLLGKQRNVFSINACLSPRPFFSEMPFVESQDGGQLGKLVDDKSDVEGSKRLVPCFPLETLLHALNWSTIDFLSLDVAGSELDILKTIPFDEVSILTMSIEFIQGSASKQDYIDFLTSKGFVFDKEVIVKDKTNEVFIYDLIFHKGKM